MLKVCKTKLFVIVLCVILVGSVMLTACGDKSSEENQDLSEQTDNDTQKNEPEKSGYKGKITMYAQAYHPVEPTESNPNPPTMLKTIAQKYTELNPGIEIEFIPSLEGQDYLAWLKTKIAGGMAPDIFWAQWADLNGGTIPKGSVVGLNKYLEMPNHYVEGNDRWADLFYPNVMEQIKAPDGQHYNIDGDYVATAVVYNKELFNKAGIDKTASNWTEFTQINKKLLDAGITPWAFAFGNDGGSKDRMTWLSRLFFTNYYADIFDELAVEGSTTSLSIMETVVAFKKGIFGPDNPKWLGWWKTIKEQAPYLQKDFVSAAITPEGNFNMFVNGQVAMIFDGSWAGRNLKNANVEFEYGTFPFPTPDSESDTLATGFNSAAAIGGPNAAFQFCISTERANGSMTDEKTDACADWLMFITTPENNSAIVNEIGSFVPIVRGAKPLPGNEELIKLFNEKPLSIDGGLGTMGPTLLDTYYRTLQQYLLDAITLEDAAEALRPVVEKAVNQKIENENLDIGKYLN